LGNVVAVLAGFAPAIQESYVRRGIRGYNFGPSGGKYGRQTLLAYAKAQSTHAWSQDAGLLEMVIYKDPFPQLAMKLDTMVENSADLCIAGMDEICCAAG